MSAGHTWFGRSITRSRSRYGKISCPGAGLVVRGFGPRATIPITRLAQQLLFDAARPLRAPAEIGFG